MLLTCGHIANSCRYHPVQNIKLKSYGWSKLNVIFNNSVINTFINNGQELFFEMVQDNNYNILLMANKQVVKKERQLFKVELDINTIENSDDFYEYVEGWIYDC
jgi:hypothetical protein